LAKQNNKMARRKKEVHRQLTEKEVQLIRKCEVLKQLKEGKTYLEALAAVYPKEELPKQQHYSTHKPIQVKLKLQHEDTTALSSEVRFMLDAKSR
jgi:hypothetical protein